MWKGAASFEEDGAKASPALIKNEEAPYGSGRGFFGSS
jgi:hypothetical protein